MKKILVIASLVAVAVCQSFGQSKAPALVLIEHADEHIGEIVRVDGVIGAKLVPPANHADVKDVTTEFKLEGESETNNVILVHSQMGYPTHGTHYRFLGQLRQQTYNGLPFVELVEQKGWPINSSNTPDPDRQVVCKDDPECEGGAASVPTEHATVGSRQGGVIPPVPTPGPDWVVIGLLIATGVIVVALFVVLIKVLAAPKPSSVAPIAAFQVESSQTVQVFKPTPQAIKEGTVKVLPGRFEVVEGDGSSRDVRLAVSSQNPGREFMITRSNNGQMPMNAIAFKDMTVSANQGKLICANDGSYTVINYADPVDRNPIVVNGRTLAKNEQYSLADNDQMAIGSVKLVYHAS